MSEKIYLLTYGDGDPGDEWYVISVHKTMEGAQKAKLDHDTTPHKRWDGSSYFKLSNDIEEWELND